MLLFVTVLSGAAMILAAVMQMQWWLIAFNATAFVLCGLGFLRES